MARNRCVMQAELLSMTYNIHRDRDAPAKCGADFNPFAARRPELDTRLGVNDKSVRALLKNTGKSQ